MLSLKIKKLSVPIIFLLSLLLLISFYYLLIRLTKGEKLDVPATLSGSVSISNVDGSVLELRGIQISILPKKIGNRIVRETMNPKAQRSALYLDDTSNVVPFNLLREEFLARKDLILEEATIGDQADKDGNYVIAISTTGSYFVYAHYMTPHVAVWWLLPIKVQNSDPIKLDLETKNSIEQYFNPVR